MTARSAGLAIITGILQIISFPLPGGLSMGFIAWASLVPLLIAIQGKTLKQAFLLGGLSGFIAYCGLLYWIIHCMRSYSDMHIIAVILVFILLVILMAAIQGLFAALLNWTSLRIPLFSLIMAPCIWVALELLKTYFPLGGFPWDLAGMSQHQIIPLIQIAELTGVYGVSFAVVLVNAALAKGIVARSKGLPAWRDMALCLAVIVLLAFFGYIRIWQVDRAFKNQPSIKTGIVQGNLDQGIKWEHMAFWMNFSKHSGPSKDILEQDIDLLIWPEAAITTYLNEEWNRRGESRLVRKISEFDAYFLVGSITRIRKNNQRYIYNSAYLFSPLAQKLVGRYDKIHLVPFGEYVPLKRVLFFVEAIAAGATGDTDPGEEVYVFDTGNFKLACVICYEVIFPDLVRRFVKQGAQFMTTITNDTWFGNTSAPYQHHANVVLRCVENRVYFARAAQTGISSIVDPVGRVVIKSELFEPAAFAGDIRLTPYRTVYTRLGDWFAYLVSICAAAGLIACAKRGRREKS